MDSLVKIYFRTTHGENTYEQTKKLFETLEPLLNNTLRTWIYIKDIDNNYIDMVRARNEIFDKNNLTKDTHFIASTGIGFPDKKFQDGQYVLLDALVSSDVINPNDILYMSNIKIMPNTNTYGVRFERGTIYNSKEYVYYIISGTASIDQLGNIKYIGNIERQIIHTLSNIHNLLLKYNQSIYNTEEIIGYVRNKKDIPKVRKICNKFMSHIKWKIIEGIICRPGWLVEFETMIKKKRQ